MIFLVVCAISAFIGWLSGYNFDHRGGEVELWVAVTLMIAVASCLVDGALKHIGEVSLLPQPPYFPDANKS